MERVPVIWRDELPEDDPIFSGTHFLFFAGPAVPVDELAEPQEEDSSGGHT